MFVAAIQKLTMLTKEGTDHLEDNKETKASSRDGIHLVKLYQTFIEMKLYESP